MTCVPNLNPIALTGPKILGRRMRYALPGYPTNISSGVNRVKE